jgi:hypothetical protein
MPVYCSSCLCEICIHCKWYDYVPDENGELPDEGHCRLRWEQRDSLSSCFDFHCRSASESDAFPEIQR